MPRRAPPADRAAVEAALPDDLHRALVSVCALLEVPFGRVAEDVAGWQGTFIRSLVEAVAVRSRQLEMMDEGVTETTALRHACEELGVNVETARSWFNRAFIGSREKVLSAHTEDLRAA